MVTPIKLCMLALMFSVYMVKSWAATFFYSEVHEATMQTHALYSLCVLGSLLVGTWMITKNGAKFIDDASRFV